MAIANILEMALLCLLLIPLLLVLHFTRKPRAARLNLPPSPPRLPIIGNLHCLGKLPHRSLRRLSAKFGPLMYLKLGQVPALVASSTEAAMGILKTHDSIFCDRYELATSRRFSYGLLDMAFAPYGENWRNMRKIGAQELFSPRKVQLLRHIREEEVSVLLSSVTSLSSSGLVNVGEVGLCLFNNITCRETFGERTSGDGECLQSRFHKLVVETMGLLSGFWIGDFFPSMGWVSTVTGMETRLRRNLRGMDRLLEEEIEANSIQGSGSQKPCFLKTLLHLQNDPSLGFPLSRDHIKAILMNIFLGGTDTSGITLEWAMTELIRSPRTMKKAQTEVRSVIRKECVEESELDQLAYLKLVIKETLRLHPPAVFLLPRECKEDCKLHGYDIPKKTRVLVNVWALGRDPKYWEEPEKFWPERFEGSSVDYRGQHFQFLPFGSGRRICPGLLLGTTSVELALANLLYCFDWKLPDGIGGDDIDMEESFGLTTHKASPLLLKATPVIKMAQ